MRKISLSNFTHLNKIKWRIFIPVQKAWYVKKIARGWMVGVWKGLNLGSIPNDNMPSQKDPKISIGRRCSTILPLISNFPDCSLSKPFDYGRLFLMYGRPTLNKGQEKSEEGNSPNHPGSSFYFTCLIRFSTRRCLYSQDHFCICRRCVSNGKIWMEFIVLSHHQIYILTSSLLGQTKTEKASKVILSFRIWRKHYYLPCTSRVEGIFVD